MAFWDFLWKTSSKTTEDLLDKDTGLLTQVGSWVGNFNFTEEEKAEFNQKMIDGAAEFSVKTLSENTVRSKSRRSIAILWIKVQLAMVLITMMVAPFSMELAKFYFGITFSGLMLSGTLTILTFFFGGYMLSGHLGLGKNFRNKSIKDD